MHHPPSPAPLPLQFQPFHPFSFAAGGDDGTCSLWDVRRPGASPHAAFSAHSGLVLSLQWHPTCAGVLATGGRDRLVQVRPGGGETEAVDRLYRWEPRR